ncbi:MAG: hypothetical protein Q8Q09_09010 [Deltaproteobacteria bacterium]|nr:hypothetical protein [Deltaproteobacteria bacterium]
MSHEYVTDEARRKLATRDRASNILGLVAAVATHAIVATVSLRAGSAEGNVARSTQTLTEREAPEETIIEGELLRQGGGGVYDPRIHREAPVREEAQHVARRGPNTNNTPTPTEPAVPNAEETNRRIFGRGNQDLAERRLAMLAASEGSNPNAPVGPGSPDGSVNGTETDPRRAGTGAGAKIQSFLRRQLHLLATATAEVRSRPFRLRIVISDDGGSIARGRVVDGSGDETVDSDLNLQLAEISANHLPIPELTDEEKVAIRGRTFAVRYRPD